MTILHALTICILAVISNLVVGPWAYASVGEKNTQLQALCLETLNPKPETRNPKP